jgi:indole-3-glycerol phosphate synthase
MEQLKKKLDNLIALKREEVQRKRAERSVSELEAAARGRRRPLSLVAALAAPGVSLITDLKRQSLGQQTYRADFEPAQIARICADNGAAAVSVLIDEIYFGGSPKIMEAVAAAVGGSVPTLYKEFIIDPYQIAEANSLGADAVLIIARPETDPAALQESIRYAHELGMEAMVEIFAAESGRFALAAGADVIGINNREYPNSTINIERGGRIRATLPPNVLAISESGLKSADDIRHAGELGFDGVLIGEAVLTAPDVANKVHELCEAGRSSVVNKAIGAKVSHSVESAP